MAKKKSKTRKVADPKMDRANNDIGKALFIFAISTFLVMVLLFLGTMRFLFREEMCSQETRQKVAKEWSRKVMITEQEINDIPQIASFVGKDNKVMLGIKETLLCEKNFKYFYIF